MYSDQACFILAGGPSLAEADLSLLNRPSVFTITLNNALKLYRSDAWISVDDPGNFIRSAWLDPKILKFIRYVHAIDGKKGKRLFNSDEWKEMKTIARNCPGIVWWKHNSHFRVSHFLTEDTICWGDEDIQSAQEHGREVPGRNYGGRSVLLAAIRIAFELGFRHVYLLGVDFDMSAEKTYAFEQGREAGAVNNNNKTYKMLIQRFTQLKPFFHAHNFHIFNCNPKSGLKTFPHVSLQEAVNRVCRHNGLPVEFDPTKERTHGLYDRKDKEKQARLNAKETKMASAQRTVRKLIDPPDTWKIVPWEQITVGDRIKMWEADGTRVKLFDKKADKETREWTVSSIEKLPDGSFSMVLRHWDREKHLKHMADGTLLPELGKTVPTSLEEETSG